MLNHLPNYCIVTNRWQILIGIGALLLGSCVYLFDRTPDHTYFIARLGVDTSFYNILPNLFGQMKDCLPSFIHAFSFILITAGIISSKKKGYIIVCAGWFVIDCVFELGQKYNSLILKIIPDWFSGVPFLENSRNYFFRGTFDVIDLAAVLTGSLTGYFVLIITMEKGKYNDGKSRWNN